MADVPDRSHCKFPTIHGFPRHQISICTRCCQEWWDHRWWVRFFVSQCMTCWLEKKGK